MGLGQQASAIFEKFEQVPGTARKAQGERAVIAGKEEENRFAKFANAIKTVKELAPTIEGQIDKKSLETDPDSGIKQIDDMREKNQFLDEAISNIGFERGEIGVHILKTGKLAARITRLITEENIDELSQMSGLPPSELRKDIGGRLNFFSGDQASKQPGVVKTSGAPSAFDPEAFQTKKDIETGAIKERGVNKFIQEASTIFSKKTVVKKANESLAQIASIETLLESDIPFATPLVIKGFIKTMENRISNTDYQLQIGNPAVVKRIQRFLKRTASGKLTKSDRQEMRDTVSLMNDVNRGLLRSESRKFAQDKAESFGLTEDKVLSLIGGEARLSQEESVRDKLTPEQLAQVEQVEQKSGKTVSDETIRLKFGVE